MAIIIRNENAVSSSIPSSGKSSIFVDIDDNVLKVKKSNGDVVVVGEYTAISSSIKGITFVNSTIPDQVMTGSISNGQKVEITSSLRNNAHHKFLVEAIVRDSNDSNSVKYYETLNVLCTTSGNTANIDNQAIAENNFSSGDFDLSASVKTAFLGDSLIFSLTSNTGSNFNYIFYKGESSVNFS